MPAFLAAWTHSTVSITNWSGDSSVELSLELKTATSSYRVPSELGASPPLPPPLGSVFSHQLSAQAYSDGVTALNFP